MRLSFALENLRPPDLDRCVAAALQLLPGPGRESNAVMCRLKS